MKSKFIIIILFFTHYCALLSQSGVRLHINDSLNVHLAPIMKVEDALESAKEIEDLLESITICLAIENNTDEQIVIEKTIGIQPPDIFLMEGQYLNICESNGNGEYFRFISKSDGTPVGYSPLMPPIITDEIRKKRIIKRSLFYPPSENGVYFTETGELKYFRIKRKYRLIGFMAQKRKYKRIDKLREKTCSTILIPPHETISFETKVFMGYFQFERGQTYNLVIGYNANNNNRNLTNICLESNPLVLTILP